jgi:hypothetical protein
VLGLASELNSPSEPNSTGEAGGVGVRDQFGVADDDWRGAELAGEHRLLLWRVVMTSRFAAGASAAIRADHGFTT